MSRFEKVRSHKNKILGIVGILLLGILIYALIHRTPERIQETNIPGKEYLEVYSSRKATQHVHTTNSGISGFSIFVAPQANIPPDDTPIIVRVASSESGEELQKITSSLSGLYRTDTTGSFLHASFPLLPRTKNNSYAFSIQAPTLTKQNPLKVSYQADTTKYLEGDLFINENKKLGSLGFAIYEQPTLLTTIVRWMVNKDHRAVWLGIVLVATGILLTYLFKNTLSKIKLPYLGLPSLREITIVSICTVIVTGIIFQPALSLFFVQDDIPILLRAKNIVSKTELIFTNHPFIPTGGVQDYAIGFYRPITYSLFPLILYKIFGLSAFAHHVIHLLLFAILSILVYIFSRFFGSSLFASITTSLWLVHSSKTSVVYWLSSSQDVISSLFFMLALILYVRHRIGVSKLPMIYVWFVYILALFSKDFSILLPAVVLLLELYARFQNMDASWKIWIQDQVRIQAPFVIISGIYLIIRTIALGDPTLPIFPSQDHSYDIAINGTAIAQNIVSYTHWTAEYFLWPKNPSVGNSIELRLTDFMVSTRVAGPFYPGLVLTILYLGSIIIFWKKKPVRYILLFSGAWWVILLAPNLLMLNERNDRWLTLPVLGSALAVTTILWQLMPSSRRIQQGIALAMLIGLGIYGFWGARLPNAINSYATLSSNAKNAVTTYQEREEKNIPTTKIYFVGVPESMRGTINRNLLLLFFPNVPTAVHYTDEEPKHPASSEAVINLKQPSL